MDEAAHAVARSRAARLSEFGIEEDYRIIVYQSQRLAAVRFASEIRYYRTVAGDYEAALAAFLPAPPRNGLPPERTARRDRRRCAA